MKETLLNIQQKCSELDILIEYLYKNHTSEFESLCLRYANLKKLSLGRGLGVLVRVDDNEVDVECEGWDSPNFEVSFPFEIFTDEGCMDDLEHERDLKQKLELESREKAKSLIEYKKYLELKEKYEEVKV